MKSHARPEDLRDGLDLFAFAFLAAILSFAPLIKGGNRPLPLLALELAALLLLAYPLVRPVFRERLSKGVLVGLVLLVLLPVLQLLPLPFSVWQELPGRSIYADALKAFGGTGMRPLSLVPEATEGAVLTLLPPLAVLLVIVSMSDDAVKKIVYLFLGMAAVQAILALVQFGGGSQTTFRVNLSDIGTGVGTYANRDHLGGMLAMTMPVALGLLASRIGRAREREGYRRKGLVGRLGAILSQSARVNQTMVFGALCIAILLGVIFSRSRSGISFGMLGILLSALLYGHRIGGHRSGKLVMLLSALGFALAMEVGLAPVLERFSVESALGDARWEIYASSALGIKQFFPLGSGLGTFPEVYRSFQPADLSYFVNHAHNDYIEYLFEGGLVAAVVIVIFVVAYLRTWPRLLHLRRWGTFSFMQAGAGLGVLLMALHGLTDFNWHIPANAIYFALMAGVFLHRGETLREEAAIPKREIRAEPTFRPVAVPAVRSSVKNPFEE